MIAEVRWRHKVELLINGVWTEMTGDNAPPRQQVPVRIGRADESSRVQPSSNSTQLKNRNGWLTPRNPASPWYPYIRRGTQLRHSVKAGTPHLTLTGAAGSKASTPDDATLDITSDWFIAVELEPPIPPGESVLVGKYSTVSNQRSILLTIVSNNGYLVGNGPGLVLKWSPDGTAANERLLTHPFTNIVLPLWGKLAWAVWLDVDDGAGNAAAHFYLARTIDEIVADPTGTQFDAVTLSGTSSVFSSSAPLEVGALANGPVDANPLAGKIRRVQVRAGSSAGAIRANPDFTAQTVGTTTFTDSASRPWTVSSPATIENWQTRFVGEIGEIAPTWVDGDVDGGRRVDVTAAGMLRRLTQGPQALKSTLYRSTLSTFVNTSTFLKGYWPFEDGRTATRAASALPGVAPAVVGGLDFASDETLVSSSPLPSISGGTAAFWAARCPVFSATDWMGEVFMKVPTVATSPAWTTLWGMHSTGTIKTLLYEVNNTTTRIRGQDADGVDLFTASTPVTPAGNNWHVLSMQLAQSGGNINYEIWFHDLVGGGSGQTGTIAGTIGRPIDIAYMGTAPADGISLGHVAITTGLAPGWRSDPEPGASNGYNTECAGTRIARLCYEENIQAQVFGYATDTTRMGPQRPDTFVNLLQEAADADGGILCEQRHQVGLAYRTRTSMYNQSPVFDVTAQSRGLINPFEPVLDDQRLRNDITVSRVGGSSARAVDAQSISDEGVYAESPPDVNVATDDQLDDLAGWELHKGTWPDLRYPSIPMRLRDSLPARALLDGWLQSGPGDLARITDLPSHHPPGPLDQIIEQQSDDIGSFDWNATIVSSPAGIWDVGVLNSATRGHLDSATSTLTGSESTTDTSWSVTSTGPRWIDSATYGSQFPFDLECDGEVVTVTAITGTSSPQTFTVTRSVNGVVKAHSTGAQVRLAQPLVLAL